MKSAHGASDYIFDLEPRPDLDHRHMELPAKAKPAAAAAAAGKQSDTSAAAAGEQGDDDGEDGEDDQEDQEEETEEAPHTEFVLCARDAGNIARYINHSCEPNLCVQPILLGHTDTRHVLIGLVAAQDIPPFTPLRCDNLSPCGRRMDVM